MGENIDKLELGKFDKILMNASIFCQNFDVLAVVM